MYSDFDKPVVAIYPRHYLSPSMTFVYRQLTGTQEWFNPIVFARSVGNLDLFPFNPIFATRDKGTGRTLDRVLGFCGWYRLPHTHVRLWHAVSKNYQVRLIHAHFGPSGIEVRSLARKLGIPLLVTFHGFDASSLLRRPHYVSDLKRLFEDAVILAVSRSMADKLLALGADPTRTFVHNIGAPLADFTFRPKPSIAQKAAEGRTIEFLQVANFVKKKGQQYTVKAFKEFLTACPHARLTLAGDGPLRRPVEKLCRDLGINDQVRFVGAVPKVQVVRLMGEADIFLHHSITTSDGDQEGIPTVLMEAMASNLVVISTLHAGIPELIDDGQNGYLVTERDMAGYLAKMIQALRDGDGLRACAREKIERDFDLVRQNKALADIYHRLIFPS